MGFGGWILMLALGFLVLGPKQMQKVLRTIRSISPDESAAILERAGIPAAARPEIVSPQAFARLYGML